MILEFIFECVFVLVVTNIFISPAVVPEVFKVEPVGERGGTDQDDKDESRNEDTNTV